MGMAELESRNCEPNSPTAPSVLLPYADHPIPH
jgi:hypothetical protein